MVGGCNFVCLVLYLVFGLFYTDVMYVTGFDLRAFLGSWLRYFIVCG